jgi:branched-chain amino acid transport system substrate-binding protein
MKKSALLVVLACLIALPAQADITVGLVIPTARNVVEGETAVEGAQQAIAYINAKGGINGQKLVLQIANGSCNTQQAAMTANQFIATGVKIVFDNSCPAAVPAVEKLYSANNLVLISTATQNQQADTASKTVFHIAGRADQQGVVQANYVLKDFRSWKVGILYDGSDAGHAQAEAFQKSLNAIGVQSATFDVYKPDEKNYSDIIAKLKQQYGIQLLEVSGSAADTAVIARAAKLQNANMQIVGGDTVMTNAFGKAAGDASEGVVMSGAPVSTKAYGYAALQVIADAIKLAGFPDAEKVAVTIHKNTFDTSIGKISFDDKGDVNGSDYIMYRWHNGQYTPVAN